MLKGIKKKSKNMKSGKTTWRKLIWQHF